MALLPVLSHKGCHVCTLPAALASNTLDYGKFRIPESTQKAMTVVRTMIEENRNAPDKYRGLPIGSSLGLLDG